MGKIQIELNPPARQQLREIFKTTEDRRLRERVQAVLFADAGRTQTESAELLMVTRRTIHQWLRLYAHGGLDALVITWGRGRKPIIPDEMAPIIIGWVKDGPQACGLERAGWTFAELATHLWTTEGIKVGETAMREFCHRHDIRPYRPTYRFLRADPVKQQAARKELAALKKSGPDQPAHGTAESG